ncbi:MAG: HAD family hydrolase, partial [Candidatus Competibacteraceae bacterium]|nr:HAD family hydrolase [Candidatus Competibacteraceae bacterium]
MTHSPGKRLTRTLQFSTRRFKLLQTHLAQTGKRLRVSNTAALQARLAELVAEVEVISFDIFDTLLERIIEPPDHVKSIVCRSLAQHLKIHYEIVKDVPDLLQCRSAVETQLRQQRQSSGFDHECRFSDIAAEMAQVILGKPDPGLTSWIIAEELRTEAEVLYVKPEMDQILAWLNSLGKRVIAISDMYLDEEHLQQLFDCKGLASHVDQIYVSSTSGVGKYSGRLFEHVLNGEKISPLQMLHIGDNHHSDHIAPAMLGIRSLWLDDKPNNRRRL